jgi:hypothetical protein
MCQNVFDEHPSYTGGILIALAGIDISWHEKQNTSGEPQL